MHWTCVFLPFLLKDISQIIGSFEITTLILLSYNYWVTLVPHGDVYRRVEAMFHPRGLTVVPPPCAQNRPAARKCTAQRSKGLFWIDCICCRTDRNSEVEGEAPRCFPLTCCFCWHVALNLCSQLFGCVCCQRARDCESCSGGKRRRAVGTWTKQAVLSSYFSIAAAVWDSSGGLSSLL